MEATNVSTNKKPFWFFFSQSSPLYVEFILKLLYNRFRINASLNWIKGDEFMLRVFDFEKTPVVELVNDIMIDASKRGASDIHFDPHENFMKIRIRIDGALSDYAEVPNSIKKNLVTRIKIIAGMNITETRLPQDGAIKATLQGINLDLRVSCLPTMNGEKIVIRILDYSMSSSGLENLGFSKSNYEKVLKIISEPNGIILVTGATGSGKSTTVYAILQRLNREDTNIITVEDPIEMNIEGINQVQTNWNFNCLYFCSCYIDLFVYTN